MKLDIPIDWAAKWARYSPNKVAFKEYETGRKLTYQELDAKGNQVAHWLTKELGLVKGDRVAVLAENCLEYLPIFAACQKTGCILVPLNYRLTQKELNYLTQDSQPSVILFQEQFVEKLPSKAEFPSLLRIDLHHFNRSALAYPTEPLTDAVLPATTDPIFILYTSGSTGWPKGVIYTHGMLHWNSINTGFSILVNSDSRTVNCMPPFHTGGWNVLMTPFFHHGGYTCIMRKFDPEKTLQAVADEKATIFMGVPTMLKRMSETHLFEEVDLAALHYILAGGEPMPIPAIETWNAKGVPIRQGYGMTEAGPNLTSLHHDDAIEMAGSIGRPNFFVQTRIVDEKGQDLPPGQAGELWIKGPMVTPGYWGNPEATQKAISDAWLHTGDMVKETPEGYLYVVDRIKNMFISGGENVYPAEVERALMEHPAISEVAVVPVSDLNWGQVGKAFVVLHPGKKADEDALKAHCLTCLAKYKIPKHFKMVDSLPKGDTGKIDRKKLKTSGNSE